MGSTSVANLYITSLESNDQPRYQNPSVNPFHSEILFSQFIDELFLIYKNRNTVEDFGN